MEVFYCKECEEWFSYDDGVYYPVISEATRYDVQQFSEAEHCVKCGAPVEVSTIVDDVVEFMNEKGVRL